MVNFIEKFLVPLSPKYPFLYEFIWFGIKQAWACIFAGLLILALVLTRAWYPEIGLSRYDFLLIYAIAIQVTLFVTKLESWREIGVIFLFHGMATLMELFKTSEAIGSWKYPEESFFRIATVPLFTGFLYSAVGSYMARAWRGFHLRFTDFPPLAVAAAIAFLAYVNFFTHHYVVDIRWPLILLGAFAFRKTVVYFTPKQREFRMPLLLGFFRKPSTIYAAA
jgi:uncharacterized membrane protein YoaT (DUF817 family)